MKLLNGLMAALFIVILAACGGSESGSGLEIRDPWVRPMVAGGAAMEEGAADEMEGMTETEDDMGHTEGMDMGSGSTSAAYMTLVNRADEPDMLISAATDAVEVVELHNNEIDENGVMRMRPVESIEIPAKGEVALAPGGYHVMLIGLKQDLVEGATVNLTLTFENAGEREVVAEIRQGS